MSPNELYVIGFVQTSWRKTLRIRDRLPNVPFDRKLGTRLLLLILSGVVDGPPVTDVTVEQDIFPCICLCFYLYLFPFSFPSKKKESLCTRLYQLCTHFGIKITTTKLEGQPLRSNPQHAGETTTSKLQGGPRRTTWRGC